MKFQFTVEQLSVFQQTLDIAIKQVGLSGLYTIVELVQVLENPVEKVDEQKGPFTYEITEKQVESFNIVFDVAVKAVGLKGATDIIILAQALGNPLPEEVEEEAQDTSAE